MRSYTTPKRLSLQVSLAIAMLALGGLHSTVLAGEAVPAAGWDFTVRDSVPARLSVGTTLEILGTDFPPESAGAYEILLDSTSMGGCSRCGLWRGPDIHPEKDTPLQVCGDPGACAVSLSLAPTLVRNDRLAVEIGADFQRALGGDEPRVFVGDIWVIFTPADGSAAVMRSLRAPRGAAGDMARPARRLSFFLPTLAKLSGSAKRYVSLGLGEEHMGMKVEDAPLGGALIADVIPGGVAAEAGFEAGDVVTSVAGVAVADSRELGMALESSGNLIFQITRGAETRLLGVDLSELPMRPPPEILDIVFILGAGALVFLLFVMPFGGIVTWVERRVWARMQSRVGPNRVGPQGFLQWVADGLKNLQKEDLIPTDADQLPFRASPYFVFVAVVATFAVLPWTRYLVPADLNIGILYVSAVVALEVVGMLMGGWGSNSKWSLLGGMRSAAQIISYEIPGGLAILSIVLLAGSLSIQDIIAAQGGAPWNWYICENPATFVAFFVMYIALLAEGNRTPFDLPEAESELVSGFATEYSGFRYVVFFFAEWVNLYVMGAIATLLFLGGWQLPGPEWWWLGEGGATAGATLVLWAVMAGAVLGAAALWGFSLVWVGIPKLIRHIAGGLIFCAVAGGAFMFMTMAPVLWHAEAMRAVMFQIKAMTLVFVAIWLRATLPRLRIDQMMSACWKYLVPGGFVIFGFNALWVAYAPGWLMTGTSWIMALCFFGLIGAFFWRAYDNLKMTDTKLDLAARFKLALVGYKTVDERYVRVGQTAPAPVVPPADRGV